jgi:hypothetical protein
MMAYYIIKSVAGSLWAVKARERSEELLADDNVLLLKRYSYLPLEPVIDVRCVSREYMDRFYDEGEFMKLMEAIVDKCYVLAESRWRAMEWVKLFVNEPTFEEIREGPVFYSSDDMLLSMRTFKERYDLTFVVFYLFDEFFCFYHRTLRRVFCSPYGSENVSVGSVARMTDDDASFVRDAANKVLRWTIAGSARYVPMTRNVKRAVETCKYILALYDLLK